jgi:trigger factor
MGAAITELSETRRRLDVEIPAVEVDAAIDRVARRHSRRAKVPGFRTGKVPVRIVLQRFKEDILQDVAHDLIPQAVKDALSKQALTPIEMPDVQSVSIEEGQPLTFHALFEVMPSVEDLDYGALTLRRTPIAPDAEAADRALEELRQRASQLVQVTGRSSVEMGDVVTLDLARKGLSSQEDTPPPPTDRHESVTIELGGEANPPGFDAELMGLQVGASKAFELSYPTDHEQTDLASTRVAYEVKIKELHLRVAPDLDDAFAQSMGEFENLDALKTKIASDLTRESELEANRGMRRDLLSQLAERVTVEIPEVLINREVTRRLEQLANRLAEQQVDPRTAKIDWVALRDEQRTPALETVRGSIVLDQVAQREALDVSDEEIEQELSRYADRLGRTPVAVRAQVEQDDGITRLREGLRREKTIELLLSRATIITA